MRRSYLIGMASIFCPSVINIEPMDMPHNTDSQNLANDWNQVGSYISDAYEARSVK